MQRGSHKNILGVWPTAPRSVVEEMHYTTQPLEVCTVSSLRFHLTLLPNNPQSFLKTGQNSAEQTVTPPEPTLTPPPSQKHRTRSPRGRKLSKMDLILWFQAAERLWLVAEGQKNKLKKRMCTRVHRRSQQHCQQTRCNRALKSSRQFVHKAEKKYFGLSILFTFLSFDLSCWNRADTVLLS